jgi:class 3 adenylate cyclase
MARLDPDTRANLPDSAFAYVDSRGRRRLPIHDEAHVRNALSRFNQVRFESDAARERARGRLLRAAKKYSIVPVGFIEGQLQTERQHAVAQVRATALAASALPTGFVTLMMTDIESSTGHLQRLGQGYRDLLNDVRGLQRDAVVRARGCEIDARGDEFFAVFEAPADAIVASADLQRRLRARTWPHRAECRIRVGIHSGTPALTDVGYIGMAVHMAARVCSAAHGGQIVISGSTREALGETIPAGIRFRDLGRHWLQGIEEAEPLFQVEADGLLSDFPPPVSEGEA